jgi:hypothetical protein
MSELRQWLGLMEAAGDPMRSEILRLFDRLPARWRAEDGSEAWKNLRFAAWLAAQPDESLAATLVSFQTTLAYLAANPKAKLSDPLKRRVPRAKVATLTTLLSRAGAPFQNWLLNLLKDDPADLQHALGDPPTKREYLDEYLQDQLSVSVLANGLITFWTLSNHIQRLIGNLPVVLYHFTSSAVMPSIRADGLHGDRKSVNRRQTEGVYLTTETDGPAVNGYIRNALAAHGGKPVKLLIQCYLTDLAPDPDDEDISSGQHQFIIPAVSPAQIIGVQRTR